MNNETLNDETAIVKIEGEVDIYSVDQFRRSIEESITGDISKIILDCTELTYIDSIGMGVLIEMRNQSQELGQQIFMKNPKPNIRKLMVLTGVDRIIDIIESPHSGS